MTRRPTGPYRTDTLFPDTPSFRSQGGCPSGRTISIARLQTPLSAFQRAVGETRRRGARRSDLRARGPHFRQRQTGHGASQDRCPRSRDAVVARVRAARYYPIPAAHDRQPGVVRWPLFRAERAPRRDRPRPAALGMVMFVAALMLASTASVAADSVMRWRPYTDGEATRCGVPVAWNERVLRMDSAGLTMRGGHPITSRAGDRKS